MTCREYGIFYSYQRCSDLLGPLTSAADLPSHPSLSVPYISPILSNMTQEACEMVQRERNTVRGAKQLLTKLRGDDIWIPCSSLDSDIDDTIFDTSKVYEEIVRSRPASKSVGRKEAHNGPSSVASLDRTSVKILVGDRAMSQELEDEQATAVLLDQGVGSKASEGALESVSAPDTFNGPGEPQMNGNSVDSNRNDQGDGTTARQDFEVQARMTTHTEIEAQAANDANTITEMEQNDVDHPPDVNVEGPKRSTPEDVSGGDQQTSIGQEVTVDTLDANRQKSLAGSLIPSSEDQEDVTMLDAEDSQPANDDQQPIAHRMRTRAQAQAVSDNNVAIRTRSPSVASSSVPSIHPLFLIPRGACPDRDFGLPPEEAEATRRILMSYVQKQEEVCRGAEKLYNGLLKVERMKKDVFDSCKAEGHVGEMSDGEDWYDKEEWGLEEDLRKGHEEEEEEGGTQNKKTRGRKRET